MAPLRALARSAAASSGPCARDAVLWALAGLALLAISGPSLIEHRRRAVDPGIYNSDIRQQIYPFFRYEDRSLFPNDLAADYHLAFLPIGFRGLYAAAALGPGAKTLSDALPYLLLAITAAALGAAAYRLGGKAPAFAAAALCLDTGMFLNRMAGGLPRAFGFPIAACALAALVWGRSRLLAALVVAGAAFYPPAAVPAGLALALWMLLPARDRGDAADRLLGRRAALVAGTAVASLLVLIPPVLASRAYGPLIRSADLAKFPEVGPGGRYGPADRAPFEPFAMQLGRMLEHTLGSPGRSWSEATRQWWKHHPTAARSALWSLLAIAAAGWVRLSVLRPAARRASLLAVAAFAGHAAATVVAPLLYHPQRYVLFPMLPFGILLLAAGAAGLVPAERAIRARRWWRPAVVGGFCVVVLSVLGGRGSRNAGLGVRIDPDAPVYRFARTLPSDALIAGWPGKAIENIPLVASRQVLVNFETHQTYHVRYTLEMRRRMRALIDAYLATDDEPILRLQREYGVSHLLIAMPALRRRELRYFEPFGDPLDRALEESRDRPLAALESPPEAIVFDDGRYRLLDLRRFAEATGNPAASSGRGSCSSPISVRCSGSLQRDAAFR